MHSKLLNSKIQLQQSILDQIISISKMAVKMAIVKYWKNALGLVILPYFLNKRF